MTVVQIIGALIAAAGVVWAFVHPSAKGEGEASYGGITLKSLTQGGLILVVGALLIVFGAESNDDDDLTLSEWATQANEICAEGYEEIRDLNIPSNPDAQFRALPQTIQIAGKINQKIQAIGRPIGAEAEVDRLLMLASQQNVATRRQFDTWSFGDMAGSEAAYAEALRLTAEVQALDGKLGANVCALGP